MDSSDSGGVEEFVVCGFDSNLERFAAVSADNRLKVWEVATGQLRHHFAQPTHLSSTYTCLSWGQSAADAIAGSKKKRGKSRELIALGTAQGDVVCWDLAKGEIVQSMRTKDEGEGGRRVHDVCFDSKCAALFSCGEGSHILQWAVVDAAAASSSQHKAVRRFKAEKRGVYKLALSNDDSLLIGAGRAHIKVWELASGRTVCKFPSHASATASLALSAPLPALFGANPALLLSSAAHDRLVNVWPIGHAVSHADVSELEISAPLLGLPCPAAPFVVSVNLHRSTDVVASSTAAASKRGKKRKHGESDAVTASDDASSNTDAADGAMHQFHILAVQTNQVSVFEVHSSGKLTAEPSSSAKGTSTTTSVHSQLTLPRTSDGSPFLYAGFKGASELLVVRGSLAKPHFQTLKYTSAAGSLEKSVSLSQLPSNLLIESLETKSKSTSTTSTSAALSNSTTTQVTVLTGVTGQAAKSTAATKSKLTAAEQANRKSFAEQLAALGISGPTSDKAASSTSAAVAAHPVPEMGSLQAVLVQALKTNDSQLIESCLAIRSPKVIDASVKRLPSSSVLPFLDAIVARLEAKPERAGALVPWIRAILVHHATLLMNSADASASPINRLHQTVDSRLSVFRKLLKLSGRLDLLLTQISKRTDDSVKIDAKPAVILREHEVLDEDDRVDEEDDDDDDDASDEDEENHYGFHEENSDDDDDEDDAEDAEDGDRADDDDDDEDDEDSDAEDAEDGASDGSDDDDDGDDGE